MKAWIASVVLLSPLLAVAATSAASKSPVKPAAAPHKAAAQAQPKPPAKPKPKPKPKPAAARKAPAAAAAGAAGLAGAAMAPRALSADQLALAERVYTGRIACELGQFVEITRDSSQPGHFHVLGERFRFYMTPVATSTGVVRLEDPHAGAVWLQIANKSMLMNQKAGQRLADECMSPEQQAVAASIKLNPPQSLLDGPAK